VKRHTLLLSSQIRKFPKPGELASPHTPTACLRTLPVLERNVIVQGAGESMEGLVPLERNMWEKGWARPAPAVAALNPAQMEGNCQGGQTWFASFQQSRPLGGRTAVSKQDLTWDRKDLGSFKYSGVLGRFSNRQRKRVKVGPVTLVGHSFGVKVFRHQKKAKRKNRKPSNESGISGNS